MLSVVLLVGRALAFKPVKKNNFCFEWDFNILRQTGFNTKFK